MLVLDQSEFQERAEFLTVVESLDNNEDVATLLDCWSHALENEGVSWLEVTNVYRGDDNYFYFITGNPSESFNLFMFIQETGGPDLTSLTARKVVGFGRGVPDVAVGTSTKPEPTLDPVVKEEIPPKPQFAPTHFGESDVNPEEEDGIDTGFFDDEEDDFDIEDEYTGKVYQLNIERIGQTIEVGPSPVRIGRGTQSEVQIQGNVRLSRVHAMFSVENDILFVEDMDSANGSYLNGFALSHKETVHVGDEVNLGGEIIQVSEL